MRFGPAYTPSHREDLIYDVCWPSQNLEVGARALRYFTMCHWTCSTIQYTGDTLEQDLFHAAKSVVSFQEPEAKPEGIVLRLQEGLKIGMENSCRTKSTAHSIPRKVAYLVAGRQQHPWMIMWDSKEPVCRSLSICNV